MAGSTGDGSFFDGAHTFDPKYLQCVCFFVKTEVSAALLAAGDSLQASAVDSTIVESASFASSASKDKAVQWQLGRHCENWYRNLPTPEAAQERQEPG